MIVSEILRTACVVALLFLISPLLRASESPESAYLPPPENLLGSIISYGQVGETDVVESLAMLCKIDPGGLPRPDEEKFIRGVRPSYCAIPAMVAEFKKVANRIFKTGRDVEVRAGTKRLNPWDLRELVAGNFMTLPDRDGPVGSSKGFDDVVSLFVMREEIVSSLTRMRVAFEKQNGGRSDVRPIVLVPRLQAYIMSMSPLGSMMTTFQMIRCGPGEVLCNQIKDRLGCAIASVSKPHLEHLMNFQSRFRKVTAEGAIEKYRRLAEIINFARRLNRSALGETLSKAEISEALQSLTADGQGAFIDEEYQNVAREILAFVEATALVDSFENFSPYLGSLTEFEKARAVRVLDPSVADSVNAIERAMQNLSLKNEPNE